MKLPFKLSRPILIFVLVLALASQACAISLFENPFPSSNPTAVPPDKLADIKVELTIIGGKIVYQRQ